MQLRTDTKKFQVLEYIGHGAGVTYSMIERFICTMNGLDYDKIEIRPVNFAYNRKTHNWERLEKPRTEKVRVHRGIWGTNLCYGPKSILRAYCKKVDNLWFLNAETAEFIRQHYKRVGKGRIIYSVDNAESTKYGEKDAVVVNHPDNHTKFVKFPERSAKTPPKSSLETQDFKSDEIRGNSKVVSVERIVIPTAPAPAPTLEELIKTLRGQQVQLKVELETLEEIGKKIAEAQKRVTSARIAIDQTKKAIFSELEIY